MKIILISLSLILSSCAVYQYRMTNVYTPTEYARYDTAVGTFTVTGQAFARTRGGGVIPAAGRTIGLTPVTDYANEYFSRTDDGRETIVDERFTARLYYRYSTVESDGAFRIDSVPPGRYWLHTTVSWYAGAMRQFCYLRTTITVTANVRAIVTQ